MVGINRIVFSISIFFLSLTYPVNHTYASSPPKGGSGTDTADQCMGLAAKVMDLIGYEDLCVKAWLDSAKYLLVLNGLNPAQLQQIATALKLEVGSGGVGLSMVLAACRQNPKACLSALIGVASTSSKLYDDIKATMASINACSSKLANEVDACAKDIEKVMFPGFRDPPGSMCGSSCPSGGWRDSCSQCCTKLVADTNPTFCKPPRTAGERTRCQTANTACSAGCETSRRQCSTTTTRYVAPSTTRYVPSTTRYVAPSTTRYVAPSTTRYVPSTTRYVAPSTTRYTPPSTTRYTSPSTTRYAPSSTTRY